MSPIEWDRITDNLKLSIIKKVDYVTFCRFHQTCTGFNIFLEEIGYFKQSIPLSTIIVEKSNDNLISTLIISNKTAEFDLEKEIYWIKYFSFDICRLKTNANDEFVRLIREAGWKNFCIKLICNKLAKDQLEELVAKARPKTLSLCSIEDANTFSNPVFQFVKEVHLTKDKTNIEVDLSMLHTIRNIETILIKNCNMNEIIEISNIFQKWEAGYDVGKSQWIFFEGAKILSSAEAEFTQNFIQKKPFFTGVDLFEVTCSLTIWLLSRFFNGKEEFALIYVSGYRAGGEVIITDDPENLIPELSVETRFEKEDIRKQLFEYFKREPRVNNKS